MKWFSENSEQQHYYASCEEGITNVSVEEKEDKFIISATGIDDLVLVKKDINNFYWEMTEDNKVIRVTIELKENLSLMRMKDYFEKHNIGEDSDVFTVKK